MPQKVWNYSNLDFPLAILPALWTSWLLVCWCELLASRTWPLCRVVGKTWPVRCLGRRRKEAPLLPRNGETGTLQSWNATWLLEFALSNGFIVQIRHYIHRDFVWISNYISCLTLANFGEQRATDNGNFLEKSLREFRLRLSVGLCVLRAMTSSSRRRIWKSRWDRWDLFGCHGIRQN